MYIYIIENLSSQLSLIYYSAVAMRKLVLLCYLSKLRAESYTKNSILCEKVNYRLEMNYKQIHEIGLMNVQLFPAYNLLSVSSQLPLKVNCMWEVNCKFIRPIS